MFELERNQVWLPDGVEPQMPAGLSAARRSKTALNDTILNARSGPGGQFRSAAELAPAPPPPAPARSRSPGRPRSGAGAQRPWARPSWRGGGGAGGGAGARGASGACITAGPGRSRRAAHIGAARAARRKALRNQGARGHGADRSRRAPAAGHPAGARRANGGSEAGPRRRIRPRSGARYRRGSRPAAVAPPRTGVEVVSTEIRNDVPYHSMRDLRNGSVVHNVTRYSARRLWYYAIMRHEAGPPDATEVEWAGPVGLWRKVRRANVLRYDLVGRGPTAASASTTASPRTASTGRGGPST